jgi:iron complex outermembrane receptor protein
LTTPIYQAERATQIAVVAIVLLKTGDGMNCRAFSLIALILIGEAALARANEPTTHIDIPSQPLAAALRQFADQTGLQIAVETSITVGKIAPAVKGELSNQDALEKLLKGKGLIYRFLDSRTVAVSQAERTTWLDKISYSDASIRLAQSDSTTTQSQSIPETPTTPDSTSDEAKSARTDEIVVTGTRIVRNGYEAPTPVSVLGAADLQAMAATNIADAVNRLPSLSYSSRPVNESADDIAGGINNLNLRGLGPDRTLVLLDGKRIVGSTLEGFNNNGGAVDINVIPNNLISRVDVVTGGASAIYGSDALAGVVNFVLDKEFTGVRAGAQGGITTYGDDANTDVSLAVGKPFADGRGHLLLSGEYAHNAGIPHNNRPWGDQSASIIVNPNYTGTNGQPQYLTAPDTGLAVATRGGLIVSGPLQGTMFGVGGAPTKFNYGPVVSGLLMSGGDWRLSRIDNDPSLDLNLRRENAFSRISFDVTDTITAFAELQWAYTRSIAPGGLPQFQLGNVTVQSGNPFIPASVQTSMTALGVQSFALGTDNADLPPFTADNGRTFRRYVVGVDGKFNVFNSAWKWDGSYERSSTTIAARTPGDIINANYTQAIDSVINPANGQIVCRSTLTHPNDGCVPFNPMGVGVNTPGAVNYVTGTGYSKTVLTQSVVAVNARGEPFSTWSGPVSLALGIEHREESVGGYTDALDAEGAFFAGNFTATQGKYDVTEGYIETVVPIAKGKAWAKSLDLSAAARATDYSTSGYVTTWKVGATYSPIADIMFRATRSRDIRAPNLGDLYNAGRSGTASVTDPATGISTTIISRIEGNPNLQPETADETGFGVVFRPSFFPRFEASVDYYNIDISNAIESLSEQEYVNRCFQGITALCSFIHRDAAGLIDSVAIRPANIQAQKTQGIDFEASYNLQLSNIVASWHGSVAFRALATRVISLETIDPQTVTQGAGVNADDAGLGVSGLFAPHFKYIASATYSADSFSSTLTARGISPGKYNNALITCSSGCPVSTTASPTINDNHIAGVTYFDLALNYKVMEGSGEVFLVTENLFDRAPPLVAGTFGSGFYAGQGNQFQYDRLGRMFRAGVRFKF